MLQIAAKLTVLTASIKLFPTVASEKPRDWAEDFVRTGVLKDATIYLNKTLDMTNFESNQIVINNCHFIAKPGFVGEYILYFGPGSSGVTVTDCILDTTHITHVQPEILVLQA